MDYFYDAETGPVDPRVIEHVNGPFDPTSLKLGNLSDPAKIQAKINKAREEYPAKCLERSTLSPLTSKVEAMGYMTPEGEYVAEHDDEAPMIRRYFARWDECRRTGGHLIGWNSRRYDAPFIRMRAIMLGIPVPVGFCTITPAGFASYSRQIDLMVLMTGAPNEYLALDRAARAFGHAGKNGDGAQFWVLFRSGDPMQRKQALNYLRNDLDMTRFVGLKLGAVSRHATGFETDDADLVHEVFATAGGADASDEDDDVPM